MGNPLKEKAQALPVAEDKILILNSKTLPVEPGEKYKVEFVAKGLKGRDFSAYFAVFVLGPDGVEIRRYVRWLNDFSGEPKAYALVFTAPAQAASVVLGYRMNAETPVSSDLQLVLPDLSSLELEAANNVPELYEDVRVYEMPAPVPLSEKEEDILEENIVGVFGSPRTGTTWLGRMLKSSGAIVEWHEPYLGHALGHQTARYDPVNDILVPARWYDHFSFNPHYFFSKNYKNAWLPAMRKLILVRAYGQFETLTKKIILKEPNGSQGADIIMECLPKAKLIFLLRDGRDVVDSRLDAHGPNTWAQLIPLRSAESRRAKITEYSRQWVQVTRIVSRAFHNHDPSRRLLVRYEDLRDNTFSEMRKVFDFIGVPISDNELEKTVERFAFKNIPAGQKGRGKFNRAASSGGWKNSLSDEEQRLMHSIMAEMLKEMGYAI